MLYSAVTVSENTAVDSQLQDIVCSDQETVVLTYTITDGTCIQFILCRGFSIYLVNMPPFL